MADGSGMREPVDLIPWILALVGTALVVDAIRFFAIGEGLF